MFLLKKKLLERAPYSDHSLADCYFVNSYSLCLPPSVTQEVAILFSLSPTNFQLWNASHISFERSLRVATFQNRFHLSVRLYHDLQTNSWTSFLSYIFDVVHQWVRLNDLYKLMESFFLISNLFLN